MQDFVNKSKYKMCISIVQKANENSIEFSLSTQTRRVIKSSQTKSLHLVVCDCFSKMAHFIATTEKTLAEGLTKLFWDHIWKLHGLSESIISDRGVQFAAEMMKELNNLLGI